LLANYLIKEMMRESPKFVEIIPNYAICQSVGWVSFLNPTYPLDKGSIKFYSCRQNQLSFCSFTIQS
ncbi:MAG: hypothetical protein AAB116_09565, partial [Candidatus Poribacteria bacterium]